MDLAPAHTVMQRARPITGRSCEMSRTALTPRCTPPMPPVTKTRMPAASAMCKDAATVVPPLNPMATATGMSRGPIFLTHLARASISSSDLERPTRILPETRAVVAGMAPPLRTMPSSSCASSRLIGYGMPCVMMADSSATTGVPLRRASWTSSAITNSSGWVSPRLTPWANPLVTLLPVLRPVSWSFSLRCALLTMMDSSEVCCKRPLVQSWTNSVLSDGNAFSSYGCLVFVQAHRILREQFKTHSLGGGRLRGGRYDTRQVYDKVS